MPGLNEAAEFEAPLLPLMLTFGFGSGGPSQAVGIGQPRGRNVICLAGLVAVQRYVSSI